MKFIRTTVQETQENVLSLLMPNVLNYLIAQIPLLLGLAMTLSNLFLSSSRLQIRCTLVASGFNSLSNLKDMFGDHAIIFFTEGDLITCYTESRTLLYHCCKSAKKTPGLEMKKLRLAD